MSAPAIPGAPQPGTPPPDLDPDAWRSPEAEQEAREALGAALTATVALVEHQATRLAGLVELLAALGL
jgi:hypothetical protein